MVLIVVPPVREMIGGRVTLGSLREFNVADLLGRRPIHTDLSQISDYVNGKVVLVTGAGGSIGSELARQVQMLGPAKLILLDRDESALHGVQLSLYGSGLLDTDDIDRNLDLLAVRLRTRRNGAAWQLAHHARHGDFFRLTADYLEHQRSAAPVHEWPV